MKCCEQDKELAAPTPCLENVQMARPRCSHTLSLRCCDAVALSELWDQQDGMAACKPSNGQKVV
eukprot:scaffold650046_cov51-Prasinocladus_malaysianus.AAC.1